jgi:hypothetical protein
MIKINSVLTVTTEKNELNSGDIILFLPLLSDVKGCNKYFPGKKIKSFL